MLFGCSSAGDGQPRDAEPPSPPYLGLTVPEPGEGFQVRSQGVSVLSGQDVEFCEVAEFPGEADDVYWVSSLEMANGKYSHHLIVEAAPDGSPAAEALAKKDIGDRVPCFSAPLSFGDGLEFVGISQSTYRSYEYPPGVGRKFHGKQRFVFDYHYFNVGEDPVQAASAVNFHQTRAADVEHVAQVFLFTNATIDTPPGQSASFLGECRATTGMKLIELTRHTHRWGKDFEVWFSGGARDGEQVFVSPSYEQNVDYVFETPVAVAPGEGFRFRCDYENTATHPLRYGPNATDEMCSLYGLWWSDRDDSPPDQSCVMARIDADGVARVRAEVTFPEPTPEGVAACVEAASTAEIARSAECTRCSCERCAVVIDSCATEADCQVILGCVNRTGCQGDQCLTECRDVFDTHSPGVGPLIQMGECISALCPVCAE